MKDTFSMGGKTYRSGHALIIAELSANHNGDFAKAMELVVAAVEAGADAIKVQTYTADSMTIDAHQDHFQISGGTMWDGKNLHDIYGEGSMPWDWQPKLAERCKELGVHFFSSPFDATAVDFLQTLDIPAYKIASFELVDIPLIQKVAATGKPLIISTGMGNLSEIAEAVDAAITGGAHDLALLKCTSAYPSPPEDMNLRTIPHLAEAFGVVAGLSDHTMGIAVPVASAAVGAGIIEKHLTLRRTDGGPDSAFSLEPNEFKAMVDAVRIAEKAMGEVNYGPVSADIGIRDYRRSLFAVKRIRAGEAFTAENIRAIRPGHGLPPKFITQVLGRFAAVDIERGTPLDWDLLGVGGV